MKLLIKISCFCFLACCLNFCSEQKQPAGPEPYYDDYGLLIDTGLLTEEDPDAPEENAQWVKWIKKNSIPVRSLDAAIFNDLQALVPFLEYKKICTAGGERSRSGGV